MPLGTPFPAAAGLFGAAGVAGSGTERGDNTPPTDALLSFVGVETAAGELTFSASSGLVVDMCEGGGFFAAATFAASAPS